MRTRTMSLALLATASTIVLASATAGAATKELPQNVPHRYVTLPNNAPGHVMPARHLPLAAVLPQWNGSFKDKTGATINFTMAGPDPKVTNAPTTVPVVLVPVVLQYSKTFHKAVFDPTTHIVASTSSNTIDMITNSPIFKSNVKFVQGGVNLGKTQYIDAFQRGNFWRYVKQNSNYHVLLGSPTVTAPLVIKVADDPNPNGDGVYHFKLDGSPVAVLDINEFDHALQKYMAANAATITPNVLPLFITYQTYLIVNHDINNGIIGGYHSANAAEPSGQTYSYATFVDTRPEFAQDVEALSHEIGEWMDDPFVDNQVNCAGDFTNGALEDGDPLEGDANFGGYPYSVGGYTYNLQSLTYVTYFGWLDKGKKQKAPSVNGWFTFQGSPTQNAASHDSRTGVCPGPQSP